jgi:L-amino acid N-acyltransferase YncA
MTLFAIADPSCCCRPVGRIHSDDERNPPNRQVLASPAVLTRLARTSDAAAIARIYNEGIEDRLATFETRPRAVADIEPWISGRYPVVVVEVGKEVIGWASASAYRPGRDAYAGVAEFSVYVSRESRGRGAGRSAMAALIAACEEKGFWKLVSRIFEENTPSRALCRAVGFREVGTYRRHGRLDGQWRDCVIVERLLGEALESAEPDADGGNDHPAGRDG